MAPVRPYARTRRAGSPSDTAGSAFKPSSDLYNVTNIPFWFNEPPTLDHVIYLFKETLFARWLLISPIIGVCVVIITLVTAVPAGYALGREDPCLL
jgi:multiple sugar transport system permease protein